MPYIGLRRASRTISRFNKWNNASKIDKELFESVVRNKPLYIGVLLQYAQGEELVSHAPHGE